MASSGDKLIYFLAGGFVGAAVALLLAPKSGADTRNFLETQYRKGGEKLAQKAREGKELLTEKSQEVTDLVEETIDRGKDLLQKQKQQVAAAVDAGRQAYEDQKRSQSDPARKAAGGKK